MRELQLDESQDDRINRQELSINRDYFLPGSNILAVEDNTFGAFRAKVKIVPYGKTEIRQFPVDKNSLREQVVGGPLRS
ncbi:hypothetical protein [Corynebacterium sp. HMSC034H07]|uniref:hypothetical protein n=1 Tax=Corynebacterium sp. HMSC034H07 TaxID=1739512 RepID=UPI0008A24797|nr:hypothetical protein [Corynebacterium sp. HMSC034H07]OFO97354.1 hypothetical protein HMPREF3009_04110 [Corynebacterium sp. HMSC034H07]